MEDEVSGCKGVDEIVGDVQGIKGIREKVQIATKCFMLIGPHWLELAWFECYC